MLRRKESIVKVNDKRRTSKAFAWVVSSLPRKSPDECVLPMLDTLVIGRGEITGWYFTSQHGKVLKKEDRNIRMKKILNAFQNRAMDSEQNAQGPCYVALVWKASDVQFLKYEELELLLDNLPVEDIVLQGFMQPRGELNVKKFVNYEHEVRVGKDNRKQSKTVNVSGSENVQSMNRGLNASMQGHAEVVINSIENVRKVKVVVLKCGFCVNEQGVVHLCTTFECEVIPFPKKTKVRRESVFDDRAVNNYTGPSALDERALQRDRRSGEIPNDAAIDAILASQTPDKVQPLVSQQEPRYDSVELSESRKSRQSRRVSVSSYLGSSQASKGCAGDFCNFKLRTDSTSSFPNMQGTSAMNHEVPFKYIALARVEDEYVKLYLRRYQNDEEGDYLNDEYVSKFGAVGTSFPGIYYKNVSVCDRCYSLYCLVEDARSKALAKIQRRRGNTPPTASRNVARIRALPSTPETTWSAVWTLATTCLSEMTKADLAEFRSLHHPPPAVVMVASAVMVLLFGKETTWAQSKKSMAQGDKFVNALRNLSLDTLDVKRILSAYAYVQNTLYKPDTIMEISLPASKFCQWTLAVVSAYAWQSNHGIKDAATVTDLRNLLPEFSQAGALNDNASSPFVEKIRTVVQTAESDIVEPKRTRKSPSKKRQLEVKKTIQRQQMSRLALPLGQREKDTSGSNLTSSDKAFTCFDGITVLPYTIIGQPDIHATMTNFIIFHDFFDTHAATQVVFRSIVAKHVGCKILLFNTPGQEDATYPLKTEKEGGGANVVLNNHWISCRVSELLENLNSSGEFVTDLPFHIVGFGNGANIATCFTILYQKMYTSLRSLVFFNGFATIDPSLASILHSSVNMFSQFPVSRPDLPVSCFTKHLFSKNYLERVDLNLALNIYTAVTNSITLQGRIDICKGALHHVDLSTRMHEVEVPIILLQSVDNDLVHSSNSQSFLERRSCKHVFSHQQTNNVGLNELGKKYIREAFTAPGKQAVALFLQSGHAVRQEAKHHVTELLSYLVHSSKFKESTYSSDKLHAKHSYKHVDIIPELQDFEEFPLENSLRNEQSAAIVPMPSSEIQKHNTVQLEEEEEIFPDKVYSKLSEVQDPTVTPMHHSLYSVAVRPDTYEQRQQEEYEEAAEREFEAAMEAHRSQKQKDIEERKQIKGVTLPETFTQAKVDEVSPPDLPESTRSRVLDQFDENPFVFVESTKRENVFDEQIEKVHRKIKDEELQYKKQQQDREDKMSDITNGQMHKLSQDQADRRTEWEKEDDAHLEELERKLYGDDVERISNRQDIEQHIAREELQMEFETPVVSRTDQDFERRQSVGELMDDDYSPRVDDDLRVGKEPADHLFKMMEAEDAARESQVLQDDDFEDIQLQMKIAQRQREKKIKIEENRKRNLLEEAMAIRIQSAARGRHGRCVVNGIRTVNATALRELEATYLLQRITRGYLGRRKARNARYYRHYKKECNKAATCIQRHAKGSKQRRAYTFIRKQKNAIEIQRVLRGHWGRKEASSAKGAVDGMRHRNKCATKIQATWKMRVARDEYLQSRVYQLAALEIQRIFRGHVARKLSRRKRAWNNAEAGPERQQLGLDLMKDSQEAFNGQQAEIDALHRAKELTETKLGNIHVELQESETNLSLLEQELKEIDQIDADLQELTNEAEMLHAQEPSDADVPIGSGVPLEGHSAAGYGFETKEEARKRQAEKYAIEMAIQLKRAEREKKKKDLEAEFSTAFAEVSQKRTEMAQLEERISDMESTRMRKEREFARLQRNLMELIEEQQFELETVKEKGIELETAVATSAAAAADTAAKSQENQKRSAAAMESTEELMKFQFMSMGITYTSALKMLNNLRTMDAETSRAAVASAASTAATAAAAASAANIPTMKNVHSTLTDAMDSTARKNKREMKAKKKQEDEIQAVLHAPFPKEMKDWTIEDVGRWLDTLSLKQYKEAFAEAAVDGDFLIDLRPEDMSDTLGMGHKLHIRKVILARAKWLPVDVQELLKEKSQFEALKEVARPGEPDMDTVFSQARNGRVKRLTESIEAGFDVNTEDDKGNTLLLIACQNVNLAIVEMLVLNRANVNHQNVGGNTALHFAMAYDTEGTLGEYLIERGANDTLENALGLSPYDGITMD